MKCCKWSSIVQRLITYNPQVLAFYTLAPRISLVSVISELESEMYSNKHSESVSSSETGAIVTGVIVGSLILAGIIGISYTIRRFKRKWKTRITPLTLEANSLQGSDSDLGSCPTYLAIPNVHQSSHQANPSHITPSAQADPQPRPEPSGQQTSTERETENIQSQMTQLQHANTELRDEVARVLGHVRRLEAQIELDAREREEDTAPPPTYVSG
ncbi:hypothetical protein BDP27DRAFT_1315555 [Rhodocollybia butyracea]|uniref:Uncharacterized protein n=1 Tax=Rhodocollybia butyracea TaxID=206335 RepID=A0A9P5Q5I4_9AGAR|nr:hypothetical protein BDP27DRAFT_1315555 [Rhodocollybia butyracea]